MEGLNRHFYAEFTSKVVASRGLPPAQVENAAQGRVFVGREAVSLGLADRIGGLWDAVLEAASKVGGEGDQFPCLVTVEPLRASFLSVPHWSVSMGLPGALRDFVEEVSFLDSFESELGFVMPECIKAEGADLW